MTLLELKDNFWKGTLCLILGESIIWAFIVTAYHQKLTTFEAGMFFLGFVMITLIIAEINNGWSAGVIGMILASIFPFSLFLATYLENHPQKHVPQDTLGTMAGLLLGALMAPIIALSYHSFEKIVWNKQRSGFD